MAPAQFFHTGKPEQNPTPSRCGCKRGCGQRAPFLAGRYAAGVARSLTHLSVSVADGLCEGAPSLSVFHLHWCIVGQQQVGTLCREGQTRLYVTTPMIAFKMTSKNKQSIHEYQDNVMQQVSNIHVHLKNL